MKRWHVAFLIVAVTLVNWVFRPSMETFFLFDLALLGILGLWAIVGASKFITWVLTGKWPRD